MRAVKAVQVRFERLSAADLEHAVNLAIAALVTYALTTSITPLLLNRPAEPVGILWAVISAVFVVKNNRERSLSAGISRLVSTCASFALCAVYLLFLPANPLGMSILIGIGALLMMLAGRRDEINLVAVTTAVILIVAAENPQAAWQQPLLRLADSVAGVAIGIACIWITSFLFFHLRGQEVRRLLHRHDRAHRTLRGVVARKNRPKASSRTEISPYDL
jgi:uncharacterized membrane protein YgaE (UPF0421/DUF939 family)